MDAAQSTTNSNLGGNSTDLSSSAVAAAAAFFQQQQQRQQQQQQQQQQTSSNNNNNSAANLPFAFMGASPLQQQLNALSGLAPNPTAASVPFWQQLSHVQQQQQQQPNANAFRLGIPSTASDSNSNSALNLNKPSSGVQQQVDPSAFLAMANMNASQQQQPAASPFPAAMGLPQLQQLQQLMTQQMLTAGAGNMPANLLALMGQHMPQTMPQPVSFLNLANQQPNLSVPGLNPNMNPLFANNTASTGINNLLQQSTAETSAAPKQQTASHKVEWSEPFAAKGKKEPPFPLKLHQILSNPEFSECVCWNSHGRSWRILKPPVFEQVVIPLYFRHAKYASFMRQVNGWGFKRIVSGNDHNSYCHELFVRDNPQLCLQMKRIKKGEAAKAKKSAGGDDGSSDSGDEDVHQENQATQQMNRSSLASTTTTSQLPFLQQQQQHAQSLQQNPSANPLEAALQSLQGAAAAAAAAAAGGGMGIQLPGGSTSMGGFPSDLLSSGIASSFPGVAGAAGITNTMKPQSALAGMLRESGSSTQQSSGPTSNKGLDFANAAGALNMAAPGLSALAGLSTAATSSAAPSSPASATTSQQKPPKQPPLSFPSSPGRANNAPPPAPTNALPHLPTGLGGLTGVGLDSNLLSKLLQQSGAVGGMPNLALFASQLNNSGLGGGGPMNAAAFMAHLQQQSAAAANTDAPASTATTAQVPPSGPSGNENKNQNKKTDDNGDTGTNDDDSAVDEGEEEDDEEEDENDSDGVDYDESGDDSQDGNNNNAGV